MPWGSVMKENEELKEQINQYKIVIKQIEEYANRCIKNDSLMYPHNIIRAMQNELESESNE